MGWLAEPNLYSSKASLDLRPSLLKRSKIGDWEQVSNLPLLCVLTVTCPHEGKPYPTIIFGQFYHFWMCDYVVVSLHGWWIRGC